GRDLGAEELAGVEVRGQVERVEVDVLVDERAQADVDLLGPLVEGVDVLEGGEAEAPAQLAVQHAEDVLVEFGGDARRVVVGELEPVDVLDQVGAEQQVVGRVEQGGDAG